LQITHFICAASGNRFPTKRDQAHILGSQSERFQPDHLLQPREAGDRRPNLRSAGSDKARHPDRSQSSPLFSVRIQPLPSIYGVLTSAATRGLGKRCASPSCSATWRESAINGWACLGARFGLFGPFLYIYKSFGGICHVIVVPCLPGLADGSGPGSVFQQAGLCPEQPSGSGPQGFLIVVHIPARSVAGPGRPAGRLPAG
jgi:hypothetical protein